MSRQSQHDASSSHGRSRPHWLQRPEPGGLPSKIALAVLALVLLSVLVAGILGLSYMTRREEAAAPNTYVQQP